MGREKRERVRSRRLRARCCGGFERMQKTTEYRNAGVIHGEHRCARILFFGAAFRQKAHSAFGIWETEKTKCLQEEKHGL